MNLESFSGTIGFIGAGNMAEAMARGLLKAGVDPRKIVASDPDETRRKLFVETLGVTAVAENSQVAERAEVLVLAVKPQVVAAVMKALARNLEEKHLVISIVAGISASFLESGAPIKLRVVRAMPNTPMLVGMGMVALAAGKHASGRDLELAKAIFSAAAKVLIVDESKMNAVTAVSGSGPAYFFYFIEALRDAGLKEGLEEEDALTLAVATAEGAARLLAESKKPPEELRRMVTSPNGTTHAAITTMESLHVKQNIIRGVRAAAARSKELGK